MPLVRQVAPPARPARRRTGRRRPGHRVVVASRPGSLRGSLRPARRCRPDSGLVWPDHVRHRLNHSGDRQLNRALHTVVMVRMRQDPRTKAYVARRLAEGKSLREIKRCLKRYVARQFFRQLEPLPGP